MKCINTTFIAVLALTTLSAWAGNSTDLSVTGRIAPSACSMALDNGGLIDFGDIQASSLAINRANHFPEVMTPNLNIVCNDKTLFGIKIADNRASTVVPGINISSGINWGDAYAYGLGSVSNGGSVVNIGAYMLSAGVANADGGTPYQIANSYSDWGGNNSIAGLVIKPNDYMLGFTNSTGSYPNLAPDSYTNLTMNFHLNLHIDKAVNLPLTDIIPLDGSATVELVYL